MSIFDVLRYPISDKPTYEQIRALPNDIYSIWVTSIGVAEPCTSPHSVKNLRKLILEYNEPL